MNCLYKATIGVFIIALLLPVCIASAQGWPGQDSIGNWPADERTPTPAQTAQTVPPIDYFPAGNNGHLAQPTSQPVQQGCGAGCQGCASCSGGIGTTKYFCGVDGQGCRPGREPLWDDERMIPWEAYAYGEYIGPHRTPHVPRYRLRVGDQIEFVFQVTREQSFQPYRLMVGDSIQITSSADEDLNQGTQDSGLKILSDGSVSLRLIGRVMAARKTIEELQDELNERYADFFETDPAIVVNGVSTDTRLQDLINAVDARFGAGGQSRQATVSPDGTVQLPMIGSVPVIGLTLEELGREINMRYRQRVQGIEVTPVLSQEAPQEIYVLGEVAQPGRFELTGPTSAMQSLALAGGWNVGGNIRQIVVFRRDQNWRLMAIKLDLAGGLYGHRPMPSDEIWLRNGDIVLVPKMPILRVADAIDLYFTRTIYSIFPAEFGSFDGQAIFQ